jgi:putative endonuclease
LTISKGKLGESIATQYLTEKNFEILERNYRIKLGEIDIIAIKGEVLFAIEVKYRKQIDLDFHPYFVMTRSKINRMKRVVEHYLIKNIQFASYDISFCLISIDQKSKVDFYSHLTN